jgi:hypothetical protein
MHKTILLLCSLLALVAGRAEASTVVIGHPNLPKLDAATVQKVFTGRAIEVAGIVVTAINASTGSSLRSRFLQTYLNQDEEKYTAYWTVRRYIGKGAPPRELANSNEVIDFVQANLGAIGYIDEADLKPGLNILIKK